jgi:hypothetical protein
MAAGKPDPGEPELRSNPFKNTHALNEHPLAVLRIADSRSTNACRRSRSSRSPHPHLPSFDTASEAPARTETLKRLLHRG